MYILNPDARRGVDRRQTLRIRNGMDESEADTSLCVHMYLNQMYGYVFRLVCDNYISLCMDMYLHQIVACNITKIFV